LIPAEPGTPWRSFLKSRFVESPAAKDETLSLAIVFETVRQHSHSQTDLVGLMEFWQGSALPVVLGFVGQLNLENREFSIRQDQSGENLTGQISENGLVMTLREASQAKLMHFMHHQALEQFV